MGSYGTTAGQVLNPATTDPGFGGVAFWPSPSTLHTQAQAAPFRGTNLVGMESSYAFFDQGTGPSRAQSILKVPKPRRNRFIARSTREGTRAPSIIFR